jgi:hydroxymethylglutaryl-CoA lyase
VANVLRSVDISNGGVRIGVHLHSRREGAAEKIIAAYEAGCRRFDSALTGLGGCPFAGDHLVGNIPTEIVVETLQRRNIDVGLRADGLRSALKMTQDLRSQYAVS